MMGAESLDMRAVEGVTVGLGAPGARHPECGAHDESGPLFKPATKRGGARPGSGPKRRPPSVVVSADGPRWYCVEVAPRTEHMVAAEVEALGIVALVPQYRGARRVRARIAGAVRLVEKAVLMPAFPGYVFAEFEAAERGWRRIATRHGVKRLIGLDPERPVAVPAVQMAWVIAQFGEDGVQRRAAEAVQPIAAGSMVRVVAGPLDGHEARVVRSDGRTVSIDWAGRSVRMAQTAVRHLV